MPAYLKSCCPHIPQRFVICALCSSGMMVMFYKRKCFRETLELFNVYPDPYNAKTTEGNCTFKYSPSVSVVNLQVRATGIYWGNSVVKAIIQAFFVGYTTSQIPAGFLADWVGVTLLMGGSMLVSSTICLVLPYLARLGHLWFMFGSIVQGISMGAIFPCTISIIARWAFISERSTFIGITLAGMYIGRCFGLLLFYIVFSWLPDWSICLYTGGVVGVLWSALWLSLAQNSPVGNSCISHNERSLIQASTTSPSSQQVQRIPKVPWISIFTSLPYQSLVLLYCALDWAHYIILNQTIKPYLINVVHLSTKLSTLTSVVEVTAVITSVAGGVFSDWMVNNQVISRTTSRRLFNFLGVVVTASLMMVIPVTGCNQYMLISLLVVIFYFKGFAESSLHVNPIDLSPSHAGLLMAIMNTTSNLSSIISRELFFAIVTEPSNLHQWEVVFWIAMVLSVVMIIPFMVHGSGEEQPWDSQISAAIPRRQSR